VIGVERPFLASKVYCLAHLVRPLARLFDDAGRCGANLLALGSQADGGEGRLHQDVSGFQGR